MKTIKVQIIGCNTTKSAIMSGVKAALNQPLTFHAYSDKMKARILESMITNRNSVIENYRLARDITISAEEMKRISNNVTIAVSFTDDEPRDGEWHEPLAPNAFTVNFSEANTTKARSLTFKKTNTTSFYDKYEGMRD